MIAARKLSALLALLYAAPLDEASWQAFLSELCAQMDARQCFYIRAEAPAPPQIAAHGGPQIDPTLARYYNEQGGRLDPYGPALAPRARTAPILADEVVDRRDLERSEFYDVVLLPFELSHAVFLPVILAPDRFEAFTIWRSPHQKPFDASSQELLELLLPHFQSALRTRRTLQASAARAERSETALDAISVPTLIVDANARIVHLNRTADVLLRSCDGMTTRGGRLTATDYSCQQALQALIRSAVAAGGAALCRPGGVAALIRPSGRRPYQAKVSPLRLPAASAPAHVLVVIGDPDHPSALPREALSALYGLTRSEAEICNALLAGHSASEIADRRRVTAGTLRGQLKAILHKTRTRRQSELVRLLMSVPTDSSGES